MTHKFAILSVHFFWLMVFYGLKPAFLMVFVNLAIFLFLIKDMPGRGLGLSFMVFSGATDF